MSRRAWYSSSLRGVARVASTPSSPAGAPGEDQGACTLQGLSRGLSSSLYAGQVNKSMCPYSPLSEEVGLLQLPQLCRERALGPPPPPAVQFRLQARPPQLMGENGHRQSFPTTRALWRPQ